MHTLTVIVPFYNEEKFLKKSVSRLIETKVADQIFLVDDCSTDNSPNVAKNFLTTNRNINYFRLKENQGKGAALSSINKSIKTTHVAIHDGDLEYNPEDLSEMFKLIKNYPDSLILGSRFIGNKKRSNRYSRTYMANKFLSLFFSLVFFKKISDIATCYKVLPVKFFKELELNEKGFSIEIEILSKWLKSSTSLIEHPISYEGRSYAEGKKIKAIDGVMYLFNTLKYRVK